MKVWELIAALEEFDGGDEVRIAQQPGWPFEYSISSERPILGPDDFRVEVDLAGDDDEPFELADVPDAVYIIEGTQLGYLPSLVRKAAGWR